MGFRVCNGCACVCVLQRRVTSHTLAAAAVLCGGWLYFSMLLPPGDSQLAQLGLTCSVFTISMYLSPLTDLVNSPSNTYTALATHRRPSRPQDGPHYLKTAPPPSRRPPQPPHGPPSLKRPSLPSNRPPTP